MIGKSIFEVVHPDDKDAVTREVLRQDRETGRGYNSYSGQLDIMGIYNVHLCMYIFPSEITSFLLKACNLTGDAKNKNKIANKLFQNNHSPYSCYVSLNRILYLVAHQDIIPALTIFHILNTCPLNNVLALCGENQH